MSAPDLVFQLAGSCNSYPWGKVGRQSLAGTLCAQTPNNGFDLKDDEPYSEMWFGDYPDFPAYKLATQEKLKDVLDQYPKQLLGSKVIDHMDSQLPYLPKILSIAKALPLQVHPNKDLASKLHGKDPSNYTDPNHKPEIAVALSKFEVFAGFKPLAEIEPLFKLEPLKRFVPADHPTWTDETLREVTRAMLKADLHIVQDVQRQLALVSKDLLGDAAYILDLLPRLQDQYGAQDAGNLVALLCMNFLVYQAGDAVWIPADGIHAYLSGDIVECMARSNNVLNTGFCPPADRDNVDLFASTLTFKAHSKQDVSLPSQKSSKSRGGKTVVYRPPMSEFDMLKTDLAAGDSEELIASEGPGVMIVTSGSGSMRANGQDFELKSGFIFFVAPGISVKWESSAGMQIHMAVV